MLLLFPKVDQRLTNKMASVYRFLLKKFKTPRPLTVVSISEDTPEDFTEEIFITTTKDLNKSAKASITNFFLNLLLTK